MKRMAETITRFSSINGHFYKFEKFTDFENSHGKPYVEVVACKYMGTKWTTVHFWSNGLV